MGVYERERGREGENEGGTDRWGCALSIVCQHSVSLRKERAVWRSKKDTESSSDLRQLEVLPWHNGP